MVKSSPAPCCEVNVSLVSPSLCCRIGSYNPSKAALSWESLPVDSSQFFSNQTFPCIPAFGCPAVLIAQGPQLGCSPG